jgi:hypothetical protein
MDRTSLAQNRTPKSLIRVKQQRIARLIDLDQHGAEPDAA